MGEPGFAESASHGLQGVRFDAYRDASGSDTGRARIAALELIERLARDEPGGGELIDLLRRHLELDGTRSNLYQGVSPPRADYDGAWDRDFAAVNGRAVDVGAVHLELGAWSSYPAQVTDQLVHDDGLAEFIRLDWDPRHALDVVGDAQVLPFADRSIDRIRADSVLEHLAYPHAVIKECYRVLRPGGWLHFVTPWVFNLHGYPDDFLRYSPSFYDVVCTRAGFDRVQVDTRAMSGLYYTLHNCIKSAMVPADEPAAGALRSIHESVITLLGALVPLDDHFEDRRSTWFHSVRVFAVKPGRYEPSRRQRRADRPFLDRALDLLACPACQMRLQAAGPMLRCTTCRRRYRVRDGVPYLVVLPKVSLARRVVRKLRHPILMRRATGLPTSPPPPPGAG